MKDKPLQEVPLIKPEGSITEAYVKYESAIKRFVSKFLPRPHDIEDVSQEAFLKAYVAERKRQIDEPKSYLFRVAKHIAISQLRKNARQPLSYIEDFDLIDVVGSTSTTEDEVLAHQRLGLRCDAVAALTPQVRRAYLMRKVYGMSHKEIAAGLNISKSTVEKHLAKGIMQCERFVRERTAQEEQVASNTANAGKS